MSRLATQSWNALKRAGFEEPYTLPLSTLVRIPGLGPKGIAYFAEEAQKLIERRML